MPISNINFSGADSYLRAAMSGLAARQRAIANNVANVDTPNFKASEVRFEDALKSAISSGDAGSPPDQSSLNASASQHHARRRHFDARRRQQRRHRPRDGDARRNQPELQRHDPGHDDAHRHPAQRHQRSVTGEGRAAPDALNVNTRLCSTDRASGCPCSRRAALTAARYICCLAVPADVPGVADFLAQFKTALKNLTSVVTRPPVLQNRRPTRLQVSRAPRRQPLPDELTPRPSITFETTWPNCSPRSASPCPSGVSPPAATRAPRNPRRPPPRLARPASAARQCRR